MADYAHKPAYIFGLILAAVFYAGNLAINALASRPIAPLFYNSTGDVSDIYYLDITPAGWAFSIWGIIYTWQVLWFIYAFSTLCRRGIDGYLYYSPGLLPGEIYVVYVILCVMLVTWLIMFDRSAGSTTYLIPAFVTIATMPLLGFICIILSARACSRHLEAMQENGLMREVWLVRMLFHNGLGIFTTWVSIAALLNLNMMLVYKFQVVSVATGGSIALGLLSAELLLYFTLDILVLDRHTRYLFIPYFVVVWASAAGIYKNYPAKSEDSERNAYWLIAIVSVAGVMLAIKVIVMFVRHFRRPLGGKSDSQTELRKQQYGSMDAAYVTTDKVKV